MGRPVPGRPSVFELEPCSCRGRVVVGEAESLRTELETGDQPTTRTQMRSEVGDHGGLGPRRQEDHDVAGKGDDVEEPPSLAGGVDHCDVEQISELPGRAQLGGIKNMDGQTGSGSNLRTDSVAGELRLVPSLKAAKPPKLPLKLRSLKASKPGPPIEALKL